MDNAQVNEWEAEVSAQREDDATTTDQLFDWIEEDETGMY